MGAAARVIAGRARNRVALVHALVENTRCRRPWSTSVGPHRSAARAMEPIAHLACLAMALHLHSAGAQTAAPANTAARSLGLDAAVCH